MDEQKPMSTAEVREAVDRAVAANENVKPRPPTKATKKAKK